MKKITLDTNAYSAISKGVFSVKEAVEHADQVFIPLFVYAELFFGFKKGSREQENTSSLANFLNLPGVSFHIPTIDTAQIYAEIFLDLRAKGQPLPTNDIWIAACAVETGSVIITFDKHFSRIAQARVWDEI